jgi:RNA polymerase primary sigma factor
MPEPKTAPKTSAAQPRDQDLVKVYLNQMSHIPPISVDEERILARELEDARAMLREQLLRCGLAIELAVDVLARVVKSEYPVDRMLLIEANDMAKKELIRGELGKTLSVVRRIAIERRKLFDDYCAENIDERSRARIRQGLELKLSQCVQALLPYRMQVSRLFTVPRSLKIMAWQIDQNGRDLAQLEQQSDDESRRERQALLTGSAELLRRSQSTPDLARRYLRSLERARERYQRSKTNLSKKNLRLVVSIAKKFRNKGLPFLDLIQEGNTGLMKALDRYQASRGNKFSTYATWWIKQTITRAIAYQSRTVRIPIHAINTLNKLIEDREDYIKTTGREPTQAELAERAKLSPKEVGRLLELNRSSLSLDQPYGGGEDGFFGDVLQDQRSETPVEASQQIMLRESIARLLKTLSYREREVLKLRYGLGDGYTYTLEEVGAIFKVSRERIRQIEVGALAKLKLPQRKDKLRGFIEETLAHD